MKRYIFAIQYNETDEKELFDKVWVDAINVKTALAKLRKQFPGVYKFHFVTIEQELD